MKQEPHFKQYPTFGYSNLRRTKQICGVPSVYMAPFTACS